MGAKTKMSYEAGSREIRRGKILKDGKGSRPKKKTKITV